ncbi:MAG TPA: histidine kinase [Dinghuibacter sp.]|uniref:sensor histidine kinase n=1 Tax=Dinghuibacter sp. TaxID=2024697 RepID=UPI002BB6E4B6|nr:histidine kinase [Dinghuibacter sp.]HTJ13900.1 histidine kinase [Dinghuibacter sp.]
MKQRATLIRLQYLVWLAILLMSFLSMVSSDGIQRSATYAVINTCFYALIIYGNIRLLYPLFYEKKRYGTYAITSLLLLLLTGAGKYYISYAIHNDYYRNAPRLQDVGTYVAFILMGITVFILSFVFRLAIAYFLVKQASEEAQLQRSQFELKLLRAQVQPHFLFNTLNNMYYEAFLDSPRTALLIERLSEIMRYFVDQSNQETVPLATEVQFLDNYIALEKIRINPEPEIVFGKNIDGKTPIPPMLLMTFVENIFKHGIDKITGCNRVEMSLTQQNGYLYFRTRNTLNRHADQPQKGGLGLANLQKRLSILYDDDFTLDTVNDGRYFTATLKVPLHESTVHDSR